MSATLLRACQDEHDPRALTLVLTRVPCQTYVYREQSEPPFRGMPYRLDHVVAAPATTTEHHLPSAMHLTDSFESPAFRAMLPLFNALLLSDVNACTVRFRFVTARGATRTVGITPMGLLTPDEEGAGQQRQPMVVEPAQCPTPDLSSAGRAEQMGLTGENSAMPCSYTSLLHYLELPSKRLFCTGVTLLPCNRWAIPKWLNQERLDALLSAFRGCVLPHVMAESRLVCERAQQPCSVHLCSPPTTPDQVERRQRESHLSFTSVKTLGAPLAAAAQEDEAEDDGGSQTPSCDPEEEEEAPAEAAACSSSGSRSRARAWRPHA